MLETFIPTPKIVMLGARRVEILPLKMRQVPHFAAAATPVINLVLAEDYAAAAAMPGAREAISIATGLELSVLDDLYPNEFLDLAAVVFEVNVGFFAQAVLPAWIRAMVAAAVAMKPAGATSLPSSPGVDTALPNA